MSMSAPSGGSNLNNDMNVTPMIDVLLVLLIIFMMIIPMSRKAIDTQLPDPTPQPPSAQLAKPVAPAKRSPPPETTSARHSPSKTKIQAPHTRRS